MSSPSETHAPNPVDVYVGGRVRLRRKMLGMSQEALADAVKLTFQQIQKYERGANRISASKLHEIASALRSPVSFFFEGLPDPVTESLDEAQASVGRLVTDFLQSPEGLVLAEIFPKITRGRVRRQVLDLVRAMAEEDGRAFG